MKYRFNNVISACVRRLLCLALLTAALLQLCAAASPDADDRSGEVAVNFNDVHAFSAVLYDNTNGLPTSEANAIAQTAEGFLWIGCYGGLIRYDGNTFERYDASTGITSVRHLYVDSRGRLWIGSNDNGLFLMEGGDIRRWGEEEGLQGLSIRGILEDDTGMLYAASTGGVALLDETLELRLPEDPRVRDTFINELRLGEDGLVYALTDDGDVFAMHGGALEWYLDRGNSRFKGISCIMPDPEKSGHMYVESRDGRVHYGTPENGFSDASDVDISPLKFVQEFHFIDGKLWICAGNGVGYLDADGFHRLLDVPMDSSVGSVTTDYEGNLWFTSTRQGVMKLVPNRFSNLLLGTGIPEAVVNTTCMQDGSLYIGTDTGLRVLRGDNPVTYLPLNVPQSIAANRTTDNLIELLEDVRIRSIIRDSQNRLWISTWRSRGLLRYDHGDLKVFSVEDGLFSDRLRTVVERRDGSFLVACTDIPTGAAHP